METLATVAQAAALMMATGGLEAIGGTVSRSAMTALTSRISALRERFRGSVDGAGRSALEAADERQDDRSLGALATAIAALAERDAGFRAELRDLAERVEQARPGATVQIAQKIANVHGFDVQGDLTINL